MVLNQNNQYVESVNDIGFERQTHLIYGRVNYGGNRCNLQRLTSNTRDVFGYTTPSKLLASFIDCL